jgi:hypothetical protein
LQFPPITPILSIMHTVIKPDAAAPSDAELAPADAPPTVIVAPELRGSRDGVVVREPDDTDADYEARRDLLTLLLDYAEKA